MAKVLVHLVAFATALLLALPPGWCVAATALASRSEQPIDAPACCRAAERHHAPEREAPCGPQARCCCSPDVVLSERTSASTDESYLPLSALTVQFVVPCTQSWGDIFHPPPLATGPRLHVLHCVWRC